VSFPQNNEKSGKKVNKKTQCPRQKPIKSQTPPADQRKLNTKTSQPSSQDESSLDEGSSYENEDDSDVEEYKADFHNYQDSLLESSDEEATISPELSVENSPKLLKADHQIIVFKSKKILIVTSS